MCAILCKKISHVGLHFFLHVRTYLPFRLGFYVHDSETKFAFVLNEFTWDFKLKGNLT